MPLVIVSGFPSSGKTTRAEQVKKALEERASDTSTCNIRQIHLINDESLGISKTSYDAAKAEKQARGTLLSAVERMVNKEDIVIADGLNHIKGFRYQMYCVARAIGTPHCVIQCATPSHVAKEWNNKRVDAGYPEAMFDDIITRYEEPDARNRWDSPLFVVAYDDQILPMENIWNALVLRKAPPPNLSTVSAPVSSTNFLHELDQITQKIITSYMNQQKESGPGTGPMVLTCDMTLNVKANNPARLITIAELRRLRRQFLQLNRIRSGVTLESMGDTFIEYLNANIQ